jgi:hypothetical protein
MPRIFTPQEQTLLDARQSALRILSGDDGDKFVEFLKLTACYYFPQPAGTLERTEGFRSAVCLIDLFKQSEQKTPEAFLADMEVWNVNWKR